MISPVLWRQYWNTLTNEIQLATLYLVFMINKRYNIKTAFLNFCLTTSCSDPRKQLKFQLSKDYCHVSKAFKLSNAGKKMLCWLKNAFNSFIRNPWILEANKQFGFWKLAGVVIHLNFKKSILWTTFIFEWAANPSFNGV